MRSEAIQRAALYARYSTDKQSEASVEDQFRVAGRIAEREGFEVVARFEDRRISGGTSARPGYQRMLEAARHHEFDAIFAEDLKRLWREQAEQWRCIKELLDLGIHIVTASGVDSRQQNFEVIASVVGAAAELDRKEAAYRTRRGLEGVAVARKSAGGKAYGYIAARDTPSGQIEINEAEAAVVQRIHSLYADGMSPRAIAALLNSDGLPSPGASWRRKDSGPNAKRRRKWVASVIHGDARRGTGILNNERYIGRVSWGRSQWKRGAADSSKRTVSQVTDRARWVTYEEPRLRIVPQVLWDRVKARQKASARAAESNRRGRPAASLLTGVLVCQECGARFIAVDRSYYGCASYKQGGAAACSNSARVKRDHVEAVLIAEIESELLSDEAIACAQRAMREELRKLESGKQAIGPFAMKQKLSKLDAQADRLRTLLGSGEISSTVAQAGWDALDRERAEALSQASREQRQSGANIIRILPHNARLYRSAVRTLSATLTEPSERQEARALFAELLGGQVKVRKEGEAVYARLELDASVLLAAAGNSRQSKDFQIGSGGRI